MMNNSTQQWKADKHGVITTEATFPIVGIAMGPNAPKNGKLMAAAPQMRDALLDTEAALLHAGYIIRHIDDNGRDMGLDAIREAAALCKKALAAASPTT